jgi:hypothetical protein
MRLLTNWQTSVKALSYVCLNLELNSRITMLRREWLTVLNTQSWIISDFWRLSMNDSNRTTLSREWRTHVISTSWSKTFLQISDQAAVNRCCREMSLGSQSRLSRSKHQCLSHIRPYLLENSGSRPLSHRQARKVQINSWVVDDQRIPAVVCFCRP